jgi:hypothetical protein
VFSLKWREVNVPARQGGGEGSAGHVGPCVVEQRTPHRNPCRTTCNRVAYVYFMNDSAERDHGTLASEHTQATEPIDTERRRLAFDHAKGTHQQHIDPGRVGAYVVVVVRGGRERTVGEPAHDLGWQCVRRQMHASGSDGERHVDTVAYE